MSKLQNENEPTTALGPSYFILNFMHFGEIFCQITDWHPVWEIPDPLLGEYV